MKLTSFFKGIKSISILIMFLFFTTSNASTVSPELTAYDIAKSTLPTVEFGNELVIYDEQLFFSASDKGLGFELWSLDITTGESSIKQDINKGIKGSSPKNFVVYQDKLYFNAYTPDSGRELWVYDKETETARLVKDLTDITDERGINASSDPEGLTVFDNVLFFLKKGDNDYIRELWYFDVQSNNFVHKDDGSFSTYVIFGGIGNVKMTVYDQHLYIFNNLDSYDYHRQFTAYSLNSTTSSLIETPVTPLEEMLINDYVEIDNEIYSTYPNGFSSYNIQTQKTTSFQPTFSGQNINPVNLILSNDKVIFSAHHSDIGYELFSFNLKTFETNLLANIVSDDGYSYSRSSHPTQFVQNNGLIYFLINSRDANIANEIWQLVTSTNEVIKKSKQYSKNAISSNPKFKVIFDDDIYFTAYDSTSNAQIWKHSLEEDVVIRVSSFENSQNIRDLTVLNDRLYFTRSTVEDIDDLWGFSHTDNNFTNITNYEVTKPNPIDSLIELNDELYFTVREYQQKIEIWSYIPDSESPLKHTDFSENDENIGRLTKYRNSVYFTKWDSSSKNELWFLYSKNKYYGPVTTPQNKSFTNLDDLIVWNNKLYFTHDLDKNLSYYDNNTNRFSEVDLPMPIGYDVWGDVSNNVTVELAYKDNLYVVDRQRFSFGEEPYYLSLNSDSFSLIADLIPGECCSEDQSWEGFSWGSNPSSFYAYDDVLYFNTYALGERWPLYDPSLNQSTLWHLPIIEENMNNPEPTLIPTVFDSYKDVSDILAFKGFLFATADVVKEGISYGYELIKLNINVTPKILLKTPEKVTEGKVVYLDGTDSSDEDNDDLFYSWLQTSGQTVNIINSDQSIATFVAPNSSEEPLSFEIIVSDGEKQVVESFSIIVAPNSSPTIELLDPITEVQENSSHQFNVSTTDAENDDVSVKWEQVSGATVFMTNSETNTVSIVFPQVNDNSIVELKVTAYEGNSESSLAFFVEIINQVENVTPPTVNKSKSGGVFNFYLLILLMSVLSKVRMINN